MLILVSVFSRTASWNLPREELRRLRTQFPQHEFREASTVDAMRAVVPEADVAFTASLDAAMLRTAPRLRWVQSPAVGVGFMLTPELAASDVVLTNMKGIRARAIAEYVLGVTIALARQLPLAVRRQAEHEWATDRLEAAGIRTLQGRRMGIVGLGSIGTAVASLASPFGMRVSGLRRRPGGPPPSGSGWSVEEVLPPDRLIDLLSRSDVVVLSAPATAATRGLIGRAEIAAMRPGSLLVNVARGRLVNDDALIAALRRGRIGGAALDVFPHEPLDPASPYWDLPNVILTPHVAGALEDYWTRAVDLFAGNLLRFEAGETLMNVVDKTVGY
jgi:phosphoglycerate dehydrogenase-like enzyme